ncbi:hypothetical protein ACQP2T_13465 [Nonomuraea sp. CA-143628]|uniref:hypothetical protein n=1 Tax=Nonomuraea sp. CA-143628 TaxID=3239997 RepID=UPI003D8D2D8C
MSLLQIAIDTADTSEEAAIAALIMSRCHASGLAAAAYRCVVGAAINLGLNEGLRGPAWRQDVEFVGALIDLECDLFAKLQHINRVIAQIQYEWANTPNIPENAAYFHALQAAADVLGPARGRVTAALNRIIRAPEELAETYAACYRHVRAGRQLPYRGRFISGEITV